MAASALNRARLVLTAGLLAMAGAGAAQAETSSCRGQVSGSVINPLPKPALVRVDITDSSAANVALGELFKAGLQAAGVTLSDTGSVTLAFATAITGLAEASSSTGAVSPDFGQVGMVQSAGTPAVLTMSISLMDRKEAQIDWVGYVTCRVMNPDMRQIARDLGTAVGHSLGQDFQPRPL